MNFQRICVFCGSNSGNNPAYRAAAIELGRLLAGRDIEIVYGAGNIGLMGILADAALAAGGKVIGVIPESLMAKEVGHLGLTELRIVKSMHERKAIMSDLSDAFIAMPGGFGTFEEFCEVVTWSQLGIQSKPCGLLNVEGYYDPLLELFDQRGARRILAGGEPEISVGRSRPRGALGEDGGVYAHTRRQVDLEGGTVAESGLKRLRTESGTQIPHDEFRSE